jgi:hypothetical protein
MHNSTDETMKRNDADAAALTDRGRRLQRELAPLLRRFYEPSLREVVPSCFLRLIDDLQYADERPPRPSIAKAA